MTETTQEFPTLCECHSLLQCPNQWMGDRKVVVTARCQGKRRITTRTSGCGQEDTVTIHMDDYERYAAGAMVQDVWPRLSAQDREIIMGSRSGYYLCADCWHELFTEREGDDNEMSTLHDK